MLHWPRPLYTAPNRTEPARVRGCPPWGKNGGLGRGNSTGWVGGYALALDADLLPQAVVEHHLDHSRARLSVTMSRAVRESVAPKGGQASTFPQSQEHFRGEISPLADVTAFFKRSPRHSISAPPCGPEAPRCSSRCSSGASSAPARRRRCRSAQSPPSPTGARASTPGPSPKNAPRSFPRQAPHDDDDDDDD